MLVEINLLKEKQKRDMTNIIIILSSAVLLSVVLYIMYIHYNNVLEESAKIEQDITETKLLSAQIEQKISEDMRTDFDDLVKTVQVLEGFFVPASNALGEMVTLLPERGFFYKYIYQNNGEIQLQMIFDSMDDISAYTHLLDSSEIVKNVSISSIDSKFQGNPRYFFDPDYTRDTKSTQVPITPEDSRYKYKDNILDSDTEHDHIPDRNLLDYQQSLGEDYLSGGHVPRYFVYFTVELDMEAVKKLRDES